jgi:hypothetical protein
MWSDACNAAPISENPGWGFFLRLVGGVSYKVKTNPTNLRGPVPKRGPGVGALSSGHASRTINRAAPEGPWDAISLSLDGLSDTPCLTW